MPPRKSNTLTEAELRLMKILWQRGESAVADLVAALPDAEALAYTSVLTTVRILEKKGYVQHRQDGRAFVYSPCVAEGEASQSELRHMLGRFFGNSRERLLLSLLDDGEVTPEELRRLKQAIAAAPDDPLDPLDPLDPQTLSTSQTPELSGSQVPVAASSRPGVEREGDR